MKGAKKNTIPSFSFRRRKCANLTWLSTSIKVLTFCFVSLVKCIFILSFEIIFFFKNIHVLILSFIWSNILLSQQHNSALPEKIIDFIIITIKFFSANEKDNINYLKMDEKSKRNWKINGIFIFGDRFFLTCKPVSKNRQMNWFNK